MARRDSLNYKIINTSNIFSSLYQNNPRMIPDVFTPECLRMQISVQPKSPVTKYKKNKGKSDKKSEKKCQNTLKKISNTGKNLVKLFSLQCFLYVVLINTLIVYAL